MAVHDMREAAGALVRTEFLMHTPIYFGIVADYLLELGRATEANESIEEAFNLQRKTNESWCLPELHRVKAKILFALGEQEGASKLLAGARENACNIGARYFELRIVNDIAQMAITDGKTQQALELLMPLYERFEEKTATEDLKRSTRLLNSDRANRTPLTQRNESTSTKQRPRPATKVQRH